MALKKLTEKQVEYLLQQYEKGRSTDCIGKELNVHQVTVCNYLHRAGVEVRPAKGVTLTTPEILDLALKMRSEGKLWKQIEAKIGITTSTLLRHIKRRRESV